jgi:hypothetical protein
VGNSNDGSCAAGAAGSSGQLLQTLMDPASFL